MNQAQLKKNSSELDQLFASDGPIASHVEGYVVREQQVELAQAVSDCMQSNGQLIAEAGTGTGKTFAYLVPALLSRKRVIISTGTKTLQEQLFHRDLPTVRDALKVPVAIAMLKGRANYLCPYRLEQELQEGWLASKQEVNWLERIKEWAGRTKTGDLSELTSIPEDAPLRGRVTSSTDNCLGGDCPRIEECFLIDARRKAQEADILVVNHYLLFADMMVKADGFGEVLPGANAFVLDEAHQIPEIAAGYFGRSLSSRQIQELLQDIEKELRTQFGKGDQFAEQLKPIRESLLTIRELFGEGQLRQAWDSSLEERLAPSVQILVGLLKALEKVLEPKKAVSRGFESLHRRAGELYGGLSAFIDVVQSNCVRWVEIFARTFVLHETPIDISGRFKSELEQYPTAWIFTSATLTVDHSFKHFASQLGIEDADTIQLGSPFDYAENALFYTPRGFPMPSNEDFLPKVIRLAELLIETSQGRAFVLFTSHRALQQAAEKLEEVLDYPLFVQGDMPKMELLKRFRDEGNAVLLGTTSFWEGVDVRGPALSLVIIDKLPFASPGDPVTSARCDWYEKQGSSAFMTYQLPNAVILLKQGVGRLIRDEKDRGVMVVCDPRLIQKGYGQKFLDSIPPMRRTNRYDEVIGFLQALSPES